MSFELMHGDCLDVFDLVLADASVDLILCASTPTRRNFYE